jgi:hypothetical protein
MLIHLVLTLSVSISITKRTFSAMKYIKTVLRNKIKKFLTNSIMIYIKQEFAKNIDSNSIIDGFYSTKY